VAVLIEAISVVVRRDAIESKYPGGWAAFDANETNNTFCFDDSLARVGFMDPNDARAYVSMLERSGVVDFAVVNESRDPVSPAKWLTVGKVRIGGREIVVAWLGEEYDGRVAVPPWWKPDSALQFVDAEEMDDRLKFLRRENGVDVYLDLRTGKEAYVGRPKVEGGGQDSAFVALQGILREALQLEAKLQPLQALRDTDGEALLVAKLKNEVLPSALFWTQGETEQMAFPHFVTGVIYRILEDRPRAEQFLKEANRLQPGVVNTLRELVRTLGEQDRPLEAIPFAREAVAAAPMDPTLWGNLAMCLIQSGQMDEAQTALREALLIDPQNRINRTIRDRYFPGL
jgi:tetratricopeptide (TPR) repeat protein